MAKTLASAPLSHPMLTMNADEQTLCGKSCQLLFSEIGLGTALTYLFCMLRGHIPLTRIFCGFRHYKDATFTPMADTLANTHNRVRTLATTPLSQEQVELLMGTDDLTPYIINNATNLTDPQTSIRIEDLASYLRIPLFVVGEATFQMIFCSNAAGTFSNDTLKQLVHITRPLGETLRDTFMHSGDVHIAERNDAISGSAVDRLYLLHGLHSLSQQVEQAAATDCTALILGETGTGKEMVADALCELSSRRNRPFIKVNCGAINDQLIDSELFGHEKGAFTGAYGTHVGYFEAANGGTIFLDEIGDLPLPLQARLLRVLDRHEIRKVGGARSIPLDIRIIAATHRDLITMIRQGKFREDLWYRLNVCVLQVPPLRAHRMDISVLTQFFLNSKAREMGIAPPPILSSEQAEKLCQHNWPGNIRELEHMVERTLVRSRIGNSTMNVAFDKELEQTKELANALASAAHCPTGVVHEEQASREIAMPHVSSSTPHSLASFAKMAEWPSLKELTDSYIQDVMRRTGGKIGGPAGAAAMLGVHPNTLRVRKQKAEPETT